MHENVVCYVGMQTSGGTRDAITRNKTHFPHHQTSKGDKHFSLYTNLWKANSGSTKKKSSFDGDGRGGFVYCLTGYKESMGSCVLWRVLTIIMPAFVEGSVPAISAAHISKHYGATSFTANVIICVSVCLFVCRSAWIYETAILFCQENICFADRNQKILYSWLRAS